MERAGRLHLHCIDDRGAKAEAYIGLVGRADVPDVDNILKSIVTRENMHVTIMFLDFLYDEVTPPTRTALQGWLSNRAVAQRGEHYELRFCDFAAFFFRREVGVKRYARCDAVSPDQDARDRFVSLVEEALAAKSQ